MILYDIRFPPYVNSKTYIFIYFNYMKLNFFVNVFHFLLSLAARVSRGCWVSAWELPLFRRLLASSPSNIKPFCPGGLERWKWDFVKQYVICISSGMIWNNDSLSQRGNTMLIKVVWVSSLEWIVRFCLIKMNLFW